MPTPSLLLIKYWCFVSYGSLAYKYILSMSSWFSIKFNNTFLFPDPKPPIINIPYGDLEYMANFYYAQFYFH